MMATLTDNPAFTANEIYEIQATDAVEGAAGGASFGGIGVSNQPHQQLANRTSLLKQRQDSNIANIATLQAFVAGFTGSLQQDGYLEIPIADINRGAVSAILQWGYYPLSDLKISGDTQFTVTWPAEFPNACFAAISTDLWVKASGLNVVANVVSVSKVSGSFVLDVPDALSSGPEQTNGFYWFAIGF
jgi:hypothetical protein